MNYNFENLTSGININKINISPEINRDGIKKENISMKILTFGLNYNFPNESDENFENTTVTTKEEKIFTSKKSTNDNIEENIKTNNINNIKNPKKNFYLNKNSIENSNNINCDMEKTFINKEKNNIKNNNQEKKNLQIKNDNIIELLNNNFRHRGKFKFADFKNYIKKFEYLKNFIQDFPKSINYKNAYKD